VLAASAAELGSIEGLGPAKGAELQAELELARRSLHDEFRRDTVLSSPGKVRDYLRISLSRLGHEVFMGLFLDSQNRGAGAGTERRCCDLRAQPSPSRAAATSC